MDENFEVEIYNIKLYE